MSSVDVSSQRKRYNACEVSMSLPSLCAAVEAARRENGIPVSRTGRGRGGSGTRGSTRSLAPAGSGRGLCLNAGTGTQTAPLQTTHMGRAVSGPQEVSRGNVVIDGANVSAAVEGERSGTGHNARSAEN